MDKLRRTVSQVLSQLGNSREARYYLRQFSSDSSPNFAVIKVGGAVIEGQTAALAGALAFLRNLGLMPIILHGAGPQLDDALSSAGVKTVKKDGLRVTGPEVMEIARPVIYRANRRLVQALEEQGVRAQGIQHGVFNCDYLDAARYGLVGAVKKVDLEGIDDVIGAGALPVVACLGENSTGQVLNINADIAARELVWAVRPLKIIFLTGTGGLLDESGRIISSISLRNDFEFLRSQAWLHSGMLLKLEQIESMLRALPDTASVSITSVENLARELFTHRGAGTLIRAGEAVVEEKRISSDLQSVVHKLLEESFHRTLPKDYFDDLPVEYILRSESNGAIAIVLKGVDGIPYLDKFAVTPEAQGAGLGAAVWQAMINLCPQLYWRSRTDNPLTRWYFEQADASFSGDDWVSFSIGVEEFSQLQRCRDDSLARKDIWCSQPATGGEHD